MPWVTPRHKYRHTCKPPRVENRLLHGVVVSGDVWRCLWCGQYHEVRRTAQRVVNLFGSTEKRLYWTKREPV